MPRKEAQDVVRTQRRGQARCRAQLDAASTLFVEKGFASTSLSDIVQRAGGSRTMLYQQFGDKDGLFRAMMEEHCSRILGDMAKVQTINAEFPEEDPEEGLIRFGLHLIQTLLDPKTAIILHTLVSEGKRIPDISQTFFHVGPERSIEKIADYLKTLTTAEKKFQIVDLQAAAEAFFGMIVGNLLLRRLIMPDESIAIPEVENYVRQSVRLFLRGFLSVHPNT